MPALECDYEVVMHADGADPTTAHVQALAELALILGGSLRRGIQIGPAVLMECDTADPPNAYFMLHISGLTDEEANLIDEAVGTQS